MIKLTSFFDRKFLIYIAVGIGNTILGVTLMFLLYSKAGFGYWGSSMVSYMVASVVSFVLNRRLTFQSNLPLFGAIIRFSLNIGICYVLAYSVSRLIVFGLLCGSELPISAVEKTSMLVGMGIFTVISYMGQRFFVFRDTDGRAISR